MIESEWNLIQVISHNNKPMHVHFQEATRVEKSDFEWEDEEKTPLPDTGDQSRMLRSHLLRLLLWVGKHCVPSSSHYVSRIVDPNDILCNNAVATDVRSMSM